MRSPKKNDSVFQLSLTELAFTLVFLLLLLSGWMLLTITKERDALLSKSSSQETQRVSTSAFEAARRSLEQALTDAGAQRPDDIISKLQNNAALASENDSLRVEIRELDAKLTALQEIERRLQTDAKIDLTEEISTALALMSALEEKSNKKIQPDDIAPIAEKIAEVLTAQPDNQLEETKPEKDLAQENRDLRGQNAYLKEKLASFGRGGRDYPPCWAHEKTGKVQFLFRIQIQPNGFRISPEWPNDRKQDALALPGIERAIQPATKSASEFRQQLDGIDQDSKRKKCRHYIVMTNAVQDLNTFNNMRRIVEQYFYKIERL